MPATKSSRTEPDIHEFSSREQKVRRALDIGFVLITAVPVSITTLFLMAAIRITTGGPAIYRQQRPGLNAVPFTIYKLRSMTDA